MARVVDIPAPSQFTLADLQRLVVQLNAQLRALQAQIDALKAAATVLVFVLLSVATAHAEPCTWQGDSGTWDDPEHWSCWHMPTASDDCLFTAASCLSPPCEIDATALGSIDCLDFDAAGAVLTLKMPNSGPLNVSGDFMPFSGVTIYGNGGETFQLVGTGNIAGSMFLNVAGSISDIPTIHVFGGPYTFQTTINAPININVDGTPGGMLDTNDFSITINRLNGFGPSNTLDLGSSLLAIRNALDYNAGSLTAGTSTVLVRARSGTYGGFLGDGLAWYKLRFDPNDAPVVYPNVHIQTPYQVTNLFTLTPGVFVDSSDTTGTLTINTLACTGTPSDYITWRSSGLVNPPGTQVVTFAMTNQPVCDYMILEDNHCTVGGNPPWPTPGGTPCIAGVNSIDLGNNLGWLFGATPPNPSLTPTATPTQTATATDTATATRTVTDTPTVTVTLTATSTATSTATVTRTPSVTPTPFPPNCCRFQATPPGSFGAIECVDPAVAMQAIDSPAACATLAAFVDQTPQATPFVAGGLCATPGNPFSACVEPPTPTPPPGTCSCPKLKLSNPDTNPISKAWGTKAVGDINKWAACVCPP